MLAQQIAELTSAPLRRGSFVAHGRMRAFMPHLVVRDVGTVAFPLLSHQADQLAAVATRAPYGRGSETIVDEAVRRVRQLEPAQLERELLESKTWRRQLDRIVARVTEGLGVTGSVSAELYKVLLYREGDFFADHRDSQKAPTMFATLVVSLPAEHDGGALIVTHGGHEARIELAVREPSHIAWAAFYADCVHRLEPVTAGQRLTLVYNLLRDGAALAPPDNDALVARVAELMRAWPSPHAKAVRMLEHRYAGEVRAFVELKGQDAGVAAVIREAARRAECACYLTTLHILESGEAEATRFDYHGNGSAFEVGEVLAIDRRLDGFVAAPGCPRWRLPLSCSEDELAPWTVLAGAKPDTHEFVEATGNEGASFERAYRRAALVVWPHAYEPAVWRDTKPREALPRLRRLLARGVDVEPILRELIRGWSPFALRAVPDIMLALPDTATRRALGAALMKRLGDDSALHEPSLAVALARLTDAMTPVLARFEARDLDLLVKLAEAFGDDVPPAALAFVEHVRTRLRARIAEPLEAPRDWSRPTKLHCNCQFCSDVARFLADPTRTVWTLKAAERDRRHVEHYASQADVDRTTNRKTRPLTLELRKNQRSHDRRVAQRARDEATLARLTRAR